MVKSLSSTRGGNGCPVLDMLGIPSHEAEDRPPSRNVVEAYGGEERSRSRNFGGEVVAYTSVLRPPSRNFGGEVAAFSGGVSRPTSRNFVHDVGGYQDNGARKPAPPSKNINLGTQRMSSRGLVYRYESQPSSFNRE